MTDERTVTLFCYSRTDRHGNQDYFNQVLVDGDTLLSWLTETNEPPDYRYVIHWAAQVPRCGIAEYAIEENFGEIWRAPPEEKSE